ncbi:hypothetical protein LX32DRAFT_687113 [Colletotrichum zoysiae]|uniref:Uncharacterized protein n=1 Tax=Colletotrichum zoysiae TaxID=1216348 RepID=A0AAD9H700_9PEZI|nr:hypothetical protein LX32DRAFT_687113 [Colletotrichum zoysiae]
MNRPKLEPVPPGLSKSQLLRRLREDVRKADEWRATPEGKAALMRRREATHLAWEEFVQEEEGRREDYRKANYAREAEKLRRKADGDAKMAEECEKESEDEPGAGQNDESDKNASELLEKSDGVEKAKEKKGKKLEEPDEELDGESDEESDEEKVEKEK